MTIGYSEQSGSASVDLSNYVTKDQLTTASGEIINYSDYKDTLEADLAFITTVSGDLVAQMSQSSVSATSPQGKVWLGAAFTRTTSDTAVQLNDTGIRACFIFPIEVDCVPLGISIYIKAVGTAGNLTVKTYRAFEVGTRFGEPDINNLVVDTTLAVSSGDVGTWKRITVADQHYQGLHTLVLGVEAGADISISCNVEGTGVSGVPDNCFSTISTDGGFVFSALTVDDQPAYLNVIIGSSAYHVPLLFYGRHNGKYISGWDTEEEIWSLVEIPVDAWSIDSSTLAEGEYYITLGVTDSVASLSMNMLGATGEIDDAVLVFSDGILVLRITIDEVDSDSVCLGHCYLNLRMVGPRWGVVNTKDSHNLFNLYNNIPISYVDGKLLISDYKGYHPSKSFSELIDELGLPTEADPNSVLYYNGSGNLVAGTDGDITVNSILMQEDESSMQLFPDHHIWLDGEDAGSIDDILSTLSVVVIYQDGIIYYGGAGNFDPEYIYFSDGSRELEGNLIPEMTGASGVVSDREIGSPTQKFKSLWVHDAHIDADSLYINEKKIIEDVSDTIIISTDEDQDLKFRTTGIGDSVIESEHSVLLNGYSGIELIIPDDNAGKDINISNSSANGGVYFTAGGANQLMEFLAYDAINFNADTVLINADTTITGTINLNGTVLQNGQPISGEVSVAMLTTTSGDLASKDIKEYADIAAAKAATGTDGILCRVVSERQIYQYVVAGSAYVADDSAILITGDGGDTRWLALGGFITYTPDHNLGIGAGVFESQTTGDENTAYGDGVFPSLTTGSGNTANGFESGYKITTGSHNTFDGAGAGYYIITEDGNVCLGFSAGPTEGNASSNKLYIHNGISDTPLIGGDFSARAVTVNGDLTVTGTCSINGYATQAWANSQFIDNSEMTTVSGDILNHAKIANEVIHPASGTLTLTDISNGVVTNLGQTGDNIQIVPQAVPGVNWIAAAATTVSGTWGFKPDMNDQIVLNGITLASGNKVSITNPVIGDMTSFVGITLSTGKYGWLCSSTRGLWQDGGA